MCGSYLQIILPPGKPPPMQCIAWMHSPSNNKAVFLSMCVSPFHIRGGVWFSLAVWGGELAYARSTCCAANHQPTPHTALQSIELQVFSYIRPRLLSSPGANLLITAPPAPQRSTALCTLPRTATILFWHTVHLLYCISVHTTKFKAVQSITSFNLCD